MNSKTMTKIQKILLIIWFYFGWFGCVYFAKWHWSPWSYSFPFVAILFIFSKTLFSKNEWIFLSVFSFFGILFDFAAFRFNLIEFPNPASDPFPHWLLAMWFLLATVFPISHRFLQSRLWLAAFLGAIFGPLSYYSGEALQILSFKTPMGIAIYALFWGTFFPATIYLYSKIK